MTRNILTVATRRRKALILSTALTGGIMGWSPAAAAPVYNLPNTGGVGDNGGVTYTYDGTGNATYSSGSNTLTVNTSNPHTIINWQNYYDIAAGHTVNYTTSAVNAAVLNRVTGSLKASEINGMLNAPGMQVWLINGSGIVFGAGSQVNVGGLVASTLDITDADFNDTDGSVGKYHFSGTTTSGVTVQSGATIGTNGQPLVLLGATIDQNGTLDGGAGAGGEVALVTGADVTMTMAAGSPLAMSIGRGTSVSGTVLNAGGTIKGKNVYLIAATQASVTDALLNVSGSVSADYAVAGDNGVVLMAGNAGPTPGVTLTGTTADVGGKGSIQLTGSIDGKLGGATLSAYGSIAGTGGTAAAGTVAASGNIALQAATGDLLMGSVTSNGGSIAFSAGGAAKGSYSAGTSITGSADTIDFTSATATNGLLSLIATGAVTLGTGNAGTTAAIRTSGDITITSLTAGNAEGSTGNITLLGANIATGTTKSLTGTAQAQASGALTGSTLSGVAGVTGSGTSIQLGATDAGAGALDLNATAGDLNVTTALAGTTANIRTTTGLGGDVTIGTLTAGGNVQLTSVKALHAGTSSSTTGSITATAGTAMDGSLIAGTDLTATAQSLNLGTATAGTGALDLTANAGSLQVTTANAGTTARLRTTGATGDITIGTLTAGNATGSTGNVTLQSAGAIDAGTTTSKTGSVTATATTTLKGALLAQTEVTGSGTILTLGTVTATNGKIDLAASAGNLSVTTASAGTTARLRTTGATGDITIGTLTAGNATGSTGDITLGSVGKIDAGSTESKTGSLTITAADKLTATLLKANQNVTATAKSIDPPQVIATLGAIDLTATGGDLAIDTGTAGTTARLRTTGATGNISFNTLTAGTAAGSTGTITLQSVGSITATTLIDSRTDSIDATAATSFSAADMHTAKHIGATAGGTATVTGNVTADSAYYHLTGSSVTLGTAAATKAQKAGTDVLVQSTAGGITGLGTLTLNSDTLAGGNQNLILDAGTGTINFAATSHLIAGRLDGATPLTSTIGLRFGTGTTLSLGAVDAGTLATVDAGHAVFTQPIVASQIAFAGLVNLVNALSLQATGTGNSLSLDNVTIGGPDQGLTLQSAGNIIAQKLDARGFVSINSTGSTTFDTIRSRADSVNVTTGGDLTGNAIIAAGSITTNVGGEYGVGNTFYEYDGPPTDGRICACDVSAPGEPAPPANHDITITAGSINLGTITSAGNLYLTATNGRLNVTAASANGLAQLIKQTTNNELRVLSSVTANAVDIQSDSYARIRNATATGGALSVNGVLGVTGIAGDTGGLIDGGYGAANLYAQNGAGTIDVRSRGLIQLGTVNAGKTLTVAAGDATIAATQGVIAITNATAGSSDNASGMMLTAYNGGTGSAVSTITLVSGTAAGGSTITTTGTQGDIRIDSLTDSTAANGDTLIQATADNANARLGTVTTGHGALTITAKKAVTGLAGGTAGPLDGAYGKAQLTAANALSVTAGTIAQLGTIQAGTDLTVNAGDTVTAGNDGAISADSATATTGNLTLTAVSSGAGASGIQLGGGTAGNNIALTTTTTGDITVANMLHAGNDVTVGAAGNATLKGNVLADAGNVIVDATAVATILKNVTAAQTYRVTAGSVTLGDGTAVTQQAGGTVDILGTNGITGAGLLTLTSNTANAGGGLWLESAGDIDFAATSTLNAGTGAMTAGSAGNRDTLGIRMTGTGKSLSLGTVTAARLATASARDAGFARTYSQPLALSGMVTLGGPTELYEALDLSTSYAPAGGGTAIQAGAITIDGTGQVAKLSTTGTDADILLTGTLSADGFVDVSATRALNFATIQSRSDSIGASAGLLVGDLLDADIDVVGTAGYIDIGGATAHTGALKLTSTGTLSLDSGSAGTTATIAATGLGKVTIGTLTAGTFASGGDIMITTASGDIALGTINSKTGSILAIASGGDLGATELDAFGGIDGSGGSVSVGKANAGGALSLTAGSGTLMLGAGNAGGAGTLTSVGDMTIGTLSAGANVTLLSGAGIDAGTTESRNGSIKADAVTLLKAASLTAAQDVKGTGGTVDITGATATQGLLNLTSDAGNLNLGTGSAGTTATIKAIAAGKVTIGTLTAGTFASGGDITITTTAGSIALGRIDSKTGSILATASGGDLGATELDAFGGISGSGGSISVGKANAGGALSLTAGSGALKLGAGNAGGAVALTSNGDMTIGTLSAGAKVTLASSAGLDAGTTESRAASIQANASGLLKAVSLKAAQDINGSGGSVNVTGATATDGLLALTANGGPLTLGAGSAGTTVALATQTAGDIQVANSLTGGTAAGSAGDVTLNSAGAINATALTSKTGLVSAKAKTSYTGTSIEAAKDIDVVANGGAATVKGNVSTTGGHYYVTGTSVALGDDGGATQVASGDVKIVSTTGAVTGGAGLTLQSNSAGATATPPALTIQSADAINFAADSSILGGTASAGSDVTLTAAKSATLGKVTAAGHKIAVSATDVTLANAISADTVALTNTGSNATRIGANPDGNAGFDLDQGEVDHITAANLLVDAKANDVQIGSVAFGTGTGSATVKIQSTGRVTMVGAFKGADATRDFTIGGDGTAAGQARQIVLITKADGSGGSIDIGKASLTLAGKKIAAGMDVNFLAALGLDIGGNPLDAATVQSRYVANPNSTLYYAAALGTPRYSTAEAYLKAGSLRVSYSDYALFQNMGQAGTSSGVVLGGTPSSPTPGVLTLDVPTGSTTNGFALFGTLNGSTDIAAALLGTQYIVVNGSVEQPQSRVNGCVIGAVSACLASSLATPPLNLNPTRSEIFQTADDLVLPFDPLLGTNNEALFTDISAVDVQIDDLECRNADKTKCAAIKGNQ